MPRFHLLLPPSLLAVAAFLGGCDDVPDLSPPNEPPVAVDDAGAILQDAATDVFVTNNDTDIDGDALTVALTREPDHGTAVVIEGFYIRYTPPRLFIGTDSFDYSITDTAGFTSEATVTLNVKQRELRALFETAAPTAVRAGGGELINRLYLVDSRAPGVLSEPSSVLAADESVRGWVHDAVAERAIMLTDSDRIVAVSLDDPDDNESFDLALSDTESADPNIDINADGVVVYSVDNQFIRTLDLASGETQSFDTGWTDSTMELQFYSGTGANVVLAGTLGTPPGTAIYQQTLASVAPLPITEDGDPDAAPAIRFFPGQNAILWLLEQPGVTPPGGYTCAEPPPQRLSNIFYTSLLNPTTSTDLNDGSGLFADPASVISYSPANLTTSVVISGCSDASDTVQIVQVPYSDPSQARVLASAASASEALHTVDFADGGESVVYTIEDSGELEVFLLELTATDATSTELTTVLPDYTGLATDDGLVAPPSSFSTDGRRWLYIAPGDTTPRKLVWMEVETQQTQAVDLPLTGAVPASDGYYAVLTEVDTDGNTEVALVSLDGGTVGSVVAPGEIVTGSPTLSRATGITLAPVPVTQD